MNAQQQRRPLRAGTEIDYCGMAATVVADAGGSRISVNCEGFVQHWCWTFEGESCTVVKEPDGKLFYDNFAAYVADFPEAQKYFPWVSRGTRADDVFIRLVDPAHAGSPHGGLVGNYMWVSMFRMQDNSVRLAAHDCDDGLMIRDFTSGQEVEAQQVLNDMKQLAPFSMWEAAKVFGFTWE